MEVMHVKLKFKTDQRSYLPSELYISTPENKEILQRRFKYLAEKHHKNKYTNAALFSEIDTFIKKATKDGNFNNLFIFRAGGIGDLIALTSIIDYFDDVNIHLVTQKKKYEALFEWFDIKPKLYELSEPFALVNSQNLLTKYSNWARLEMEGVIENGHQRNWFELFFSFIDEHEPWEDLLRPQLVDERINDNPSNIQRLGRGKPSLLICNKATAMMRTCHASDIIMSLPKQVKENYDIFVYQYNLSQKDVDLAPYLAKSIKIIEKSTLADFFLDCFDADHVISVDTGALHFREGVCKPAIGLYNSFTTDSRTKYYKYTKSIDISSECPKQPCFLHETIKTPFCYYGNKEMFAAPCFDSNSNKTLREQLTKIFSENL